MSAPITPYVKLPLAVLVGLSDRSLTAEQLDIYLYCYFKAERPDYRVRSYSAENVCLFRGLDANQGHLKKYKRAAAGLYERCLLSRDYRRIDTTDSKLGRTYSVWVPVPERFQAIGTPDENRIALWGPPNEMATGFLSVLPVVPLVVPDNVRVPSDATALSAHASGDEQQDNVPVSVPLNGHMLSIPNHSEPTATEKEPLNPPIGGLDHPPVPPVGGKRLPLGLKPSQEKQTGREKPLNSKQYEQLLNAARFYADFCGKLYKGFTPNDINAVCALLREFEPIELLFAQTDMFPLGKKANHKTMANFFANAARNKILVARLQGESKAKPYWLEAEERRVEPIFGGVFEYYEDVVAGWEPIIDAWQSVFGKQEPDAILVGDDVREASRKRIDAEKIKYVVDWMRDALQTPQYESVLWKKMQEKFTADDCDFWRDAIKILRVQIKPQQRRVDGVLQEDEVLSLPVDDSDAVSVAGALEQKS